MLGFARFSFVFFTIAIFATTLIRGTTAHLPGIVGFALATIRYMGAGPWVIYTLPFFAYFGWKHPKRLSEACVAFVATIALVSGYTLFKALIPSLVPFWADPMLAEWDRALHGGHDPWVLAHSLSAWIDTDGAAFTYSGLWGAFAFSFPVLLALSDQDEVRKARYLWLYAISWVLIGDILAVAFSAAGPIYFELVTGRSDFAPMLASLRELTFPGTSVDRVQQALWREYSVDGGLQLGGSGISAFPSMHVAIATIWAIYVSERSIIFAPVGIAFAATILFLSVYTGWHYAVDGYASIALVGVIFVVLRIFLHRKMRKAQRKAPSQIDQAHA
ncbi:phosphatase PAP2 family protein [Celeribacter litoreus]|uniref:phosphatase PAP2 family protein n=1 Tax=Celeribacter litoreus TaxID=2876714 RepID=UPI001CCF7FCC|nr:phosphatase PAP2 family protein [Celeribacter litoreus]MCA0044321.1 phosphatase PAP2 family protein [Celeribacter litoreus]